VSTEVSLQRRYKNATLPFDLASYRFPITYRLEEGHPEEERSAERKKLAGILEKAIRDILDSQEYKDSLPKAALPPAVKYREPLDGRARFRAKAKR
jgi:hypothetical protein